MHRFDVRQFADVVLFEPGAKTTTRPGKGFARVAVADCLGEEFEKAADGMLAGADSEIY